MQDLCAAFLAVRAATVDAAEVGSSMSALATVLVRRFGFAEADVMAAMKPEYARLSSELAFMIAAQEAKH